MIAITLAASLLLQNQETKTFQDKALDLQFQYPATWKVEKVSFGHEFSFLIGKEPIVIRVIQAPMPESKETYQASMKQIQEGNGGVVLRQWEEELLGVPLLMTSVRKTTPTSNTMRLLGLLFTNDEQSMSFSFECSEASYQEAEKLWRDTLLTSRTVSGKLPQKGGTPKTDPAVDPGKTETPPDNSKTVILTDESTKVAPIFGPVRVTADSDRGIYAYLPEGWSLADGKLTHPTFAGELTLMVGTGGEEALLRTWLKMCGDRLAELSTVTSRKEPRPVLNKAGFKLRDMIRTGEKDGKPWTQRLTLGTGNGYYWIVDFSGESATFDGNRKLLDALMQQLGLKAE